MADPKPLSASDVGSFAYKTVKDRLPVIVTKIIDHLCRHKIEIAAQHGENALEDCKEVVGRLSQLKNELQTNKPLRLMQPLLQPSPYDDIDIWNNELERYTLEIGSPPKWFTASWLYVECYLYAWIHQAFSLCASLHDFDPFQEMKRKNLMDSMSASETLATHMLSVCGKASTFSQTQMKDQVRMLTEVSLWGNKCDLSISGGAERAQERDIITSLTELRPNILDDNFDNVWQFLVSLPEDQRDIVLVLDNAGFELITDLCYMTFLMESGFATSLTIHTKTRPWFVSDTLLADITWTIDTLRENGGSAGELATRWASYLADGRWKVRQDKFWTTHYDFPSMKDANPNLYSELSEASLIIFKGDLNYRKLTGDLNWPRTTTFQRALRGFNPAPLLALRTAKGGPIVGLAPGVAERMASASPDRNEWDVSGDYGMIQFCLSV